MRLKNTKSYKEFLERIDERKIYIDPSLKEKMDKLISENRDNLDVIRVGFEPYSYKLIRFSKEWVAFETGEYHLNRKSCKVYKMVQNSWGFKKTNLSKTFSKGRGFMTASDMVLDDHSQSKNQLFEWLDFLNLDWLYKSVDFTSKNGISGESMESINFYKLLDLMKFKKTRNAFKQLIRGNIQNTKILKRYVLESMGFDETTAKHLDTLDHRALRTLQHFDNPVKVHNNLVKEYDEGWYYVNNVRDIMNDYVSQLKELNITSSKTTFKSISNHHNELSDYIAKIKVSSFENRLVKCHDHKVFEGHPSVTVLNRLSDFYIVGNKLRNCIYSGNYFDRVNNGQSLIVVIDNHYKPGVISAAELVMNYDNEVEIYQHKTYRNEEVTEPFNIACLDKFIEDRKDDILDYFKTFDKLTGTLSGRITDTSDENYLSEIMESLRIMTEANNSINISHSDEEGVDTDINIPPDESRTVFDPGINVSFRNHKIPISDLIRMPNILTGGKSFFYEHNRRRAENRLRNEE